MRVCLQRSETLKPIDTVGRATPSSVHAKRDCSTCGSLLKRGACRRSHLEQACLQLPKVALHPLFTMVDRACARHRHDHVTARQLQRLLDRRLGAAVRPCKRVSFDAPARRGSQREENSLESSMFFVRRSRTTLAPPLPLGIQRVSPYGLPQRRRTIPRSPTKTNSSLRTAL